MKEDSEPPKLTTEQRQQMTDRIIEALKKDEKYQAHKRYVDKICK